MATNTAYLACITPFDLLQNMLASFRVVNERISLRTVNELEMLCARLPKDGFWGHFSFLAVQSGLNAPR